MKWTIALLICMCSALALAQNECVYDIPAYNFCLTSSGTLASLPGILDPNNAVEGWGYDIWNEDGWRTARQVFPGEGKSYPTTASQPNGPGTLPVIFWFDAGEGEVKETVTATKNPKTISFKMTVTDVSQIREGSCRPAPTSLQQGAISSFFGSHSYYGKPVGVTFTYQLF